MKTNYNQHHQTPDDMTHQSDNVERDGRKGLFKHLSLFYCCSPLIYFMPVINGDDIMSGVGLDNIADDL